MQSPQPFDRRTLLRRLSFGLLGSALISRKASAVALDRLVEAHPASAVRRYHRRLRVHATILVLGVPIFKRNDVGAGCATVEIGSAGGETITALQFAAGSDPARAHGLNRLGLMRELVIEQNTKVSRSSYSGFMTSSPEKSLDQGKHAIEEHGNEIPCTLSSGESVDGETNATLRHFSMPGSTGWEEAATILKNVESAEDPRAHHDRSPSGPSATFLYAIRRAAIASEPASHCEFVHNGKVNQLVTRRQGTELSGSILDLRGEKLSDFSVWLDPSDPSGIPNRIEFRARSFLRLSFVADPPVEQAQAEIPWLLEQKG
ncbi:MAG TPA: hypothetical protein VK419_08050 [Bryobacteraceae bacterium]|nr:hypothetical protein [Bryobacteraceae bacterium]